MNKARRKEICNIIQKLNNFLSRADIDVAIDGIQIVLDEEECVMDNIPENLQNGYRYQESEEACDNLNDAISELEDIDDEYSEDDIQHAVNNAIQYLNNCI